MTSLSERWSGPAWGEPSSAVTGPPPLRSLVTAATAAYRAEAGRSDRFVVVASSVSGVSHRLSKRRCEDFFGWALPSPERLALVVADGVGSAGRGGEGAELAVDKVCRFLSGSQVGWGPAECFNAIAEAHAELERAGGPSAAELATTIVIALVTCGEGRASVTLARVGDSSAFSLSEGGEWRELFGLPGEAAGDERGGERRREEGEAGVGLIVSATAVLPFGDGRKPLKRREGGAASGAGSVRGGEAPAAHAGLDRVSPNPVEVVTLDLPVGAALVLVTDGVAEPLRDGPTTVAPQLAELLRGGPAGTLTPLELARAADFSRRGAHDDRTVLAAWTVSMTRSAG